MKRYLYFFVIAGFYCQNNFAQTPISGVINDYAKVTAIDSNCQSKLTVDDTTGFEVGMKVILIQIKGVAINESNTSAFGNVINYGSAGFYEKNEIDSIDASSIFLKYQLLHDYDIAGKVQLVTMPFYENAIVTNTLTASAWDGEKGGILAFTVENDLVLNDNIDLSGKGFRGGNSISVSPNDCGWLNQQNDFYYGLNNWRGADKGEGAAAFISGKEAGKGAQNNGGGGGNDHNSGGGGGSNISSGGRGGDNDEPQTFGCKGYHPGVGGKLINFDSLRIFFGGGGGAGHGNNDLGTDGGNGGGIVILEAGSLASNGFKIIANGETPPDGFADGAGGGGSGGTLVLKVDTLADALTLELKGGNGGLVNNNGAERCHGPGGGGGGGLLLHNFGTGSWSVLNNGGDPGLSINSASCPDSSNGATGGTQGFTWQMTGLPQSTNESGIMVIENQPLSQEVCEGDTAFFTISTVGVVTNYQWQVDSGTGFQDISDGSVFSGTMTDSLTVLNPTLFMSGWVFQCLVSNDCGELISESASLEVNESASITGQPESMSVCEGESAGFSIAVGGNVFQYQWQADSGSGFQDISDGAIYSGTMTDSLIVLNPTLLMSGWIFLCIVSNDCGELNSESAGLEVNESASIVGQPESVSVCEGESAVFSITVVGNVSQYQWQVDDGSGFQDISDGAVYSGTMTDSLTVLNPTLFMSGWVFQCLVSNVCGELISESASLEVNESASIVGQPESVSVCEGESAVYSITTVGNVLQYQWQVDSGTGFQDISDGAVYAGTMTDSLTVLNPTLLMSGWVFQCLVSNVCGELISETANLEVIGTALIMEQPESVSVCEGENAIYSITIDGNVLEYQWQVDEGAGFFDLAENAIYSNTNTAVLTISTIGFSMDGYVYRCIVTDGCGNVLTSSAAQLTVETLPTAQFDYLVNGSLVSFENLSSSNSMTFEWNFGDNSTSSTANPSHDYAESGIYTVRLIAMNNCGADTIFQEVGISFLEVPAAAFTLDNGIGCAPLIVQFSDQSTGQIDSWQWAFPGGTPGSSSEQNPQVIYSTPGIFDVTLEVTNAAGSDGITFEEYIFVDVPVFAGFSFSVNGNVVSFTNTTQNATSFQWDFGDNSPGSTEENPVHTYAIPGVYLVTLVASNSWCGSAVTLTVDVIFTGTEKVENDGLMEVFPNPVTHILFIRFLQQSGSKTLKLFHSNGQLVFEKQEFEGDDLEINITGIPAGMYVLEVITEERVFIKNIVKN